MTNPAFTQVTFRLRNDNGSETTATWRQTQGTDDTIDTGSNFRCRFLIDETASRVWTNKNWNLYYQLNSGGYAAVTAATPVQFSASTNFTDGDDCTSQLTGGTGTFVTNNNGMKETTGGATNTGTAGQLFELEWCLRIDAAQVADNDTINLRVYDGTSAIAAYTDTPVITVNDLGVALTKTISNTVQVADTLSKILNKIKLLTDTTEVSDTIAKSIGRVVLLTDTENISDIISRARQLFITIANLINPSDSIANARDIAIVLSDTVNPSDIIGYIVTSGGTWQYSYPIADVTSGIWTNELDSYVNIYLSIDEEVADDDDYIQSPLAPSNDSYETLLSGLGTPVTKTDHTLYYRYSATLSGLVDLTAKLMQGETEIAAWVHSGIGTDWITAEQSLTQEQMDAITDYTNLRVIFMANV